MHQDVPQNLDFPELEKRVLKFWEDNKTFEKLAARTKGSAKCFRFVDGPITGAGVTPAVPNGSSFKKIERGVPVTVDYGGGYNGYTTDETRTTDHA